MPPARVKRASPTWAIPVLKFNYRFGDNEIQMAKDMAETSEEMLKAAGAEDIRVRRDILTEGWSIHELGTARMGKDPKTSVTNSFGQTHDVKNLFVVDGSIFVSASCQNPTWTILALCWRAMDTSKRSSGPAILPDGVRPGSDPELFRPNGR
jgi:choline dehydrogenase-like flavoprotein